MRNYYYQSCQNINIFYLQLTFSFRNALLVLPFAAVLMPLKAIIWTAYVLTVYFWLTSINPDGTRTALLVTRVDRIGQNGTIFDLYKE